METRRVLPLSATIAGVVAVTFVGHAMLPANAPTVGFAYLLYVLIVASAFGFWEALLASVLATLTFNFFFFPPVGTFTIADPQNWIALFSFLVTSVIASRLSATARRRTLDALERQRDVERLYALSRAILLIDDRDSFPKQLVERVADIFELNAAVLYEGRTGKTYRAGPTEFEGAEDQLLQAAMQGQEFADTSRQRIVTPVKLGSGPIGSLGLQGATKPDSVLQGVANLVAIGLERARAHELSREIKAAQESERLRTALIDAMAHELKTPLTAIKAATSALLSLDEAPADRTELLKIADEEAEHLRDVIESAIELARLDTAQIVVEPEMSSVTDAIADVVLSMQRQIDGRKIELTADPDLPKARFDPRLLRLALKQLLDNALKYSPPEKAVSIHSAMQDGSLVLSVTDYGEGIPAEEQRRIFERFYRSPRVQHQTAGSGLGLTIAHRIALAHGGDLTVTSQRGKTTFRVSLPLTGSAAQTSERREAM
jgi:two-component system sensor histidine kinase KdpD